METFFLEPETPCISKGNDKCMSLDEEDPREFITYRKMFHQHVVLENVNTQEAKKMVLYNIIKKHRDAFSL